MIWNISHIELRMWNQVSYDLRSYDFWTPLKSWVFQASIRNCVNCVHNWAVPVVSGSLYTGYLITENLRTLDTVSNTRKILIAVAFARCTAKRSFQRYLSKLSIQTSWSCQDFPNNATNYYSKIMPWKGKVDLG